VIPIAPYPIPSLIFSMLPFKTGFIMRGKYIKTVSGVRNVAASAPHALTGTPNTAGGLKVGTE
jgi:hypothetical protein